MINPDTSTVLEPRRGHPPKVSRQFDNARQALTRLGLKVLIETGYPAAGIETVIKSIDVPKGSFYHYFKNKGVFDLAVLSAYGDFLIYKLDKFLLDDAMSPLGQMTAFVRRAGQGMEKYQSRRGCLVGSLLQGAPLLPDTFSGRLKAILTAWESHVAHCLHETQTAGAITRDASPDALAQVL